MSAVAVETTTNTHNPLDIVEEIVTANEWPFDRSSEDEMIVEIAGRWCDYRLYFVWQQEVSAMQFSCQFDMKVPPPRRATVNELLADPRRAAAMGEAGRRRVVEEFSWTAVAEQTVEVYRKVLRQHS